MKVSVIAVTSIDAAIQPDGGIDAMRQQIARDAAARHVTSSRQSPAPPCGRSCRDGPVLQELGAVVEDASQAAFVDQLLGHHHRRHAPVVVPDHVRDAGLSTASTISSRFLGVAASGFSHSTILPALRRRDGDLCVRVIRARDIDQVDILALDEFPPVGFHGLKAPVRGERLRSLRIPRANRFQTGRIRRSKKLWPCGRHSSASGP